MNIKHLALSGLSLALACTQGAYAQTKCDILFPNVNHYDRCTADTPQTIDANVGGTFSSTTSHLDELSDWIPIKHLKAWRCTTYRNEAQSYLWTGLHTWINNGYLQASFPHDGETYTLYQAGNNENRVGYIMHQNLCITQSGGTSQCHSKRAMHINNTNTAGTDTTSMQRFCLNNAHQKTYHVQVETEIRLFKWDDGNGSFPASDFSLPSFQVAEFRWWSQVKGGQFGPWPGPEIMAMRERRYSTANAIFIRSDKTCTTPASQTVPLPTVPKDVFTGNPVAGNTPFTLELTDCDPNLSTLEYSLFPSAQNLLGNNALGILALTGTSTATGVMVQVLDGNGTPVNLSASVKTPVPGYSAGQPTATIPLQAQYIKTGNLVTAGSVFAVMSVTYTYQ